MTLHVETASAGHLMAVGILQVLRVHTQCKVESCVQQYIVYGTPVYSTPVYTVQHTCVQYTAGLLLQITEL